MNPDRTSPVEAQVQRLENPSALLEQPVLNSAVKKALEILENSKQNPSDFGYIDSIKDSRLVDKIKSSFDNDPKLHAVSEVLEVILYLQCSEGKWFGEDTGVTLANEYDDYVNGVDVLVEFTSSERRPPVLALGVDVTMSKEAVREKIRRIKESIESDTLTDVKYFESSKNGVKLRLSGLPRVVIGLDSETILGLSQLFVQNKKRELASHLTSHVVVLTEVYEQLVWGLGYAQKINSEKAIKSYKEILDVVNPVYVRNVNNKKFNSVEDEILNRIRYELNYQS